MLFNQAASAGTVDRPPILSAASPATPPLAQLMDYVHPALVVFRFALALQVAALTSGQFAVFLLRDLHLGDDIAMLFVQRIQ